MNEKYAAALDALFRSRGSVTVDDVIREARKKSSPLHGFFEWDPVRAHPFYLKERAQTLIRKWYVEYQEANGETISVRAAVSLPATTEDEASANQNERAYVLTDFVLKSDELTRQMLDGALRELSFFKTKYATLHRVARLRKVFAAIDDALESERAPIAAHG